MRTIVIANTVREGRRRFPAAAAILTPRARVAARGIAADRVVVLRGMHGHPALPSLRADALPCLLESSLAAGDPSSVRLQSAEDGKPDDPIGEHGTQDDREQGSGDDQDENVGRHVHAPEGSSR